MVKLKIYLICGILSAGLLLAVYFYGKKVQEGECKEQEIQNIAQNITHVQQVQNTINSLSSINIKRMLCEKYATNNSKWNCDSSNVCRCE